MGRAAWNTSFDVWSGHGFPGGPPSVLIGVGGECRVVPQEQILQYVFPYSDSEVWMTYGPGLLPAPDQSQMLPLWVSTNYYESPRIAIPSGTDPQWIAVREEAVFPYDADSYGRVLLIPLPPPRDVPEPGFGACDAPLLPFLERATFPLTTFGERWYELEVFDAAMYVLWFDVPDMQYDFTVWIGTECDDLELFLGTTIGGEEAFYLPIYPGYRYWIKFDGAVDGTHPLFEYGPSH